MYKADSVLDKVKFVREAAVVDRCHTVPHFGNYPVGLHSYNMLAILRILWSDCPINLVWAILEHDVPERLTGDIPSPVKWFKIVDRDQLKIAEATINAEIFGCNSEDFLNLNEMNWLRGLDILELYMWCRDQEMLGNKNVRKMMGRIDNHIRENTHLFAEEVISLYYNCIGSTWEMMPDLGELT